ncbi:MAG: EpsG family protein [Bacteroidales bacterium]|jgi:hypothetical protein|nr:EpsG family protein [Bacteroidales bacterium]
MNGYENSIYYKICNVYIIIILSFAVATRIFGFGPDYLSYKEIFSASKTSIEPFFSFLRNINLILFHGNIFTIYFCVSVIALILKFEFISAYAHNTIFSLMFYICTFFFLHEYTQFRAAVAIGIFFSSLGDISHHRLGHYIFKTIIAFLFHYSAVLMLVIYFYCNGIKARGKNYLLFPWAVFIFDVLFSERIRNINFLGGIVQNISQQKNYLRIAILYFERHKGHFETGPTVFNKVYLSVLLICSFVYYAYNGFKEKKYENDYLLFKILSFTVFSFYFFLNFPFPVLAFRVSEYFFPVISVILPNLIIRIREKQMFFIIIWIYVFLLSYLFLTRTTL